MSVVSQDFPNLNQVVIICEDTKFYVDMKLFSKFAKFLEKDWNIDKVYNLNHLEYVTKIEVKGCLDFIYNISTELYGDLMGCYEFAEYFMIEEIAKDLDEEMRVWLSNIQVDDRIIVFAERYFKETKPDYYKIILNKYINNMIDNFDDTKIDYDIVFNINESVRPDLIRLLFDKKRRICDNCIISKCNVCNQPKIGKCCSRYNYCTICDNSLLQYYPVKTERRNKSRSPKGRNKSRSPKGRNKSRSPKGRKNCR